MVKNYSTGNADVNGKDCGQWGKVKAGGQKQNGTCLKN
jgi:hypothetical protein